MTANPVFVDGVPPAKSAARAFLGFTFGDADALRGLVRSVEQLAFVKSLDAFFAVDTADSTSPDDGASVIVDASGARWKLIGGGATTVANRAALKALPAVVSSTAFLAEARREGTFIQRAGSPPVADTQEGVYVVSDTASFYWERVYSAIPDVSVFGAVQDGTTDDTAAIQGALDVLGVAYVDASKGESVEISNVSLQNSGDELIGIGWPTLIQGVAGTTPVFIENSFQKFKGFKLNGAAATLGVPFVRIRTDLRSMTTLDISEHYLIDCGSGIMDMDDGVNRANFVNIEDITAEGHRGYGVATWDCWASYHIDRVVVDRVGETGADFNFPAFYVNGSEGVFFRNCAHNGSAGTSIQVLQTGVVFEGCNFVVIDNFIPDHSGGNGIRLIGCNNVKMDKSTAVNCNLEGVLATSCSLVTMSQIHATQLAGGAATTDGFHFAGCTTVRGSGLLATGFTRDGFRGDACSRLRIEGEFSNNAGRGFTTVNSGVVNQFHGCGTFGNAAGNFDVDGTTDFVRQSLLQSGANVDLNGPASG